MTMNGSLPPSSSTVFLMCFPGGRRDAAARAFAARERHRRDAIVGEDAAPTASDPMSKV